jgi:hypothetical protein
MTMLPYNVPCPTCGAASRKPCQQKKSRWARHHRHVVWHRQRIEVAKANDALVELGMPSTPKCRNNMHRMGPDDRCMRCGMPFPMSGRLPLGAEWMTPYP